MTTYQRAQFRRLEQDFDNRKIPLSKLTNYLEKNGYVRFVQYAYSDASKRALYYCWVHGDVELPRCTQSQDEMWHSKGYKNSISKFLYDCEKKGIFIYYEEESVDKQGYFTFKKNCEK